MRRATVIGLWGGFLAWILGFGALGIFALVIGSNNKTGLLAFRTATLGDGLLLPLLLGLVLSGAASLSPTRGERGWILTAWLIGALGGVAVQAAWLFDDSPRLNWTLPVPHSFNTAGWYHAAFFVAASGSIVASTVWLLKRLRGASNREKTRILTGPGATIALMAALTFIGLAAFEAGPSTFAGLVTVLGLVVAVTVTAALFAWVVRFPSKGELVRPAITAIVGAVGLVLFDWTRADRGAANLLVVAGASLCLGTYLCIPRDSLFGDWPTKAVATMFLLAGTAVWAFGTIGFSVERASFFLLISGAAAVGLPLDAETFKREYLRHLLAVLSVTGSLMLSAYLDDLRSLTREQALVAISGVVLGFHVFALPPLKIIFSQLMDAEAEAAITPGSGPERLPQMHRAVWIQEIALSAAISLALLLVVSTLWDIFGLNTHARPLDQLGAIQLTVLTIVVLCVLMLFLIARRKKSVWTPRASVPVGSNNLAMATSLLLAAGAASLLVFDLERMHFPGYIAVPALIAGLLAAENVAFNARRLQEIRLGRAGLWVAIASGVTVSALVLWLLGVGLWPEGYPLHFGSGLVLSAVVLALAWASSCACGAALIDPSQPRATQYPPLQNLAVDHAMYLALTLLALAVPMIAWSRLEPGTIRSLWVAFLVPLEVASVLSVPFLWIRRNNRAHLLSQEELFRGERDDWLRDLRHHVRFQNVLAGILFVASGIIVPGLVVEFLREPRWLPLTLGGRP